MKTVRLTMAQALVRYLATRIAYAQGGEITHERLRHREPHRLHARASVVRDRAACQASISAS